MERIGFSEQFWSLGNVRSHLEDNHRNQVSSQLWIHRLLSVSDLHNLLWEQLGNPIFEQIHDQLEPQGLK